MLIKDIKDPKIKALAMKRRKERDKTHWVFADALPGAFYWENTPEGHDFWEKVNDGHFSAIPKPTRSRSAKTGQYVSKATAKRRPATTVTEKPAVTYGQVARAVRTWVGQQADHDTRLIAEKVLKVVKGVWK